LATSPQAIDYSLFHPETKNKNIQLILLILSKKIKLKRIHSFYRTALSFQLCEAQGGDLC
jgi:hypothetical protein